MHSRGSSNNASSTTWAELLRLEKNVVSETKYEVVEVRVEKFVEVPVKKIIEKVIEVPINNFEEEVAKVVQLGSQLGTKAMDENTEMLRGFVQQRKA